MNLFVTSRCPLPQLLLFSLLYFRVFTLNCDGDELHRAKETRKQGKKREGENTQKILQESSHQMSDECYTGSGSGFESLFHWKRSTSLNFTLAAVKSLAQTKPVWPCTRREEEKGKRSKGK